MILYGGRGGGKKYSEKGPRGRKEQKGRSTGKESKEKEKRLEEEVTFRRLIGFVTLLT